MENLLKKLNYKNQKEMVLLQAPPAFLEQLMLFSDELMLKTKLSEVCQVECAMIFVTKQKEIDELIPQIAPKLKDDALLWMCYPKGTSKKFKCDFNRDTGWAIMGSYEMESVRMVAIDKDWSALRFRKVAYIKVMKRRTGTLSEAGKRKANL
ncbi:MAG: hypothetical protein QM530_09745 [Phycisphaerales bacterium]|nr:hypothetical protein [Phycisphaerales bacterium]